MKRIVLIFLLLAQPASAGPFEWVKHHKRFLLVEGAAITGATIHAKGLRRCQRINGVEPCDEHYGTAWASYGILTGMNVIVMPAITESCWKDGGGKWCNLLAFGGSTAQGVWGIHEWRIHEKDKTPAPVAALRF